MGRRQKDEEFKANFSYIENLIKASLGYMTRYLHKKKRQIASFKHKYGVAETHHPLLMEV